MVRATATAAASIAAPEPAPTRPAAKVGEPIDGRFALAVDCTGTDLAALSLWSVGKGLLGVCGVEVRNSAVFQLAASGPARLAPEVFKDLPLGAEGAVTTFGIFDVEGGDLEHLTANVVPLMTRTGVSYRFRRAGAAWKKIAAEPFDSSVNCVTACAEIDGHTLVEREDEQHRLSLIYEYDKGKWLPARGKVPGCDRPVAGFTFLRLRGKELWGIGNACGKLAAQRWTVGSAETSAVSLDVPAASAQPKLMGSATVFQVGETWIYFEMETRAVLRFDGKQWRALGRFPGEGWPSFFHAGGQPWLWSTDYLFRASGPQIEQVLVPEAKLAQVATSPTGEIRVWTGKALYSLGEGDLWHPVSLPASSASLHELRSVAGRWSYWREGEGVKLFVEGAEAPALHIDSPASSVSPIGYVTPLSRDCEHPFATLYKLGKGAPKDYDFPSTRAALAGQGELIAGRFSEVAALGDRYLVARYEGPNAVALLSRLTRLVEKKVQGAKPQLLCADSVPGGLPVTRDVSMK
jgi:hypothetical protein